MEGFSLFDLYIKLLNVLFVLFDLLISLIQFGLRFNAKRVLSNNLDFLISNVERIFSYRDSISIGCGERGRANAGIVGNLG